MARPLRNVVAGATDFRLAGHPVVLLETFVDTSRFQGVCYRAANWSYVGNTTGRTRQNKSPIPQAPPKAVWLYPLRGRLAAPLARPMTRCQELLHQARTQPEALADHCLHLEAEVARLKDRLAIGKPFMPHAPAAGP
ncbi:MAG TPA: DUF4338 domain-containing protein [Verrucomicrobiota bacterium]|nr:DUF4338 domain-containing protein [Verrucomicrobiota bacterium]HRZ36171.1 DUF4338 domain-containing protein [Candidatus Paceibacterota bacterium]HRZ54148.1 DUF4338 domain-containing protein [Candidatus Paceibacterota bacterium]